MVFLPRTFTLNQGTTRTPGGRSGAVRFVLACRWRG
jgi:hypothetical protein